MLIIKVNISEVKKKKRQLYSIYRSMLNIWVVYICSCCLPFYVVGYRIEGWKVLLKFCLLQSLISRFQDAGYSGESSHACEQ